MSVLMYGAAFVTGILASMGLGGGMVLILYMTLIAGVPQMTAQGINLIFFIPIALAAVIMHTKNKLIEWKKIIPAMICGAAGAVGGTFLANAMGNNYLTKAFAIFVFVTGIKEILKK